MEIQKVTASRCDEEIPRELRLLKGEDGVDKVYTYTYDGDVPEGFIVVSDRSINGMLPEGYMVVSAVGTSNPNYQATRYTVKRV